MPPTTNRNYALVAKQVRHAFPAPKLPYEPPRPKRYHPKLGLIGCGGISATHLDAYRRYGFQVAAFCDCVEAAAKARRDEFYPKANVYTDYRKLLEREDIEVLDIAVHPAERVQILEAALRAGKHVLSQKPFVLDLDTGKRLVALARAKRCKLAVNQNGRWAPYVSYISQAIRRGLIGEVQSVSMTLNWDHTWIQGTPFEKMHHVILYDFAIHWFDMCALFFRGQKARSVCASTAFAPAQNLKPPMLGSATIQFERGLATLLFDAHSKFGPEEAFVITGTQGTIRARGALCGAHHLTLFNRRGFARPKLRGKWFNDGFAGTMAELLCAIEQDREPENSARENLESLAICFAAVQSANTGRTVKVGKVRRVLDF